MVGGGGKSVLKTGGFCTKIERNGCDSHGRCENEDTIGEVDIIRNRDSDHWI